MRPARLDAAAQAALIQRLNVNLSEVSRVLAQRLTEAGVTYVIAADDLMAGIATCDTEPGTYERWGRPTSFTIRVHPGCAREDRFAEEIIPHELAHAVQCVEDGKDLILDLYDEVRWDHILDLFLHPRVYDIQVNAGMPPDSLRTWHEAGYSSQPPGRGPDAYLVWLSSLLSSHKLDAIGGVLRGHIADVQLLTLTEKLLGVVRTAQDRLADRDFMSQANKDAIELYRQCLKPRVWDSGA